MFQFWVIILALVCSQISGRKPLLITSKEFSLKHIPHGYHPENPDRITAIHNQLDLNLDKYEMREPSALFLPLQHDIALEAIHQVHTSEYIREVKQRSRAGARQLSPWDQDTYLSRDTFDLCIIAQSAWLDSVHHVLEHSKQQEEKPESTFAFAITRPPGHHAEQTSGGGFCIFNFAAATAFYALQKNLVQRVAILDFDVHYGNGVADIVKENPNIRYVSLHQGGIFPMPPAVDGVQPSPHKNIMTINLDAGFDGNQYLNVLKEQALPFLLPFGAELLIVCAGFDAMVTEELASGGLVPSDYYNISRLIRSSFGGGIVLGLEGGYDCSHLGEAVVFAADGMSQDA